MVDNFELIKNYIEKQMIDREDGDCYHPVSHIMWVNAQELMFMARKRLCGMVSKNAQKIMRMIRDEVLKTNPEFEDVLVPNCQYLHSCPEFKSCGRWKEEK